MSFKGKAGFAVAAVALAAGSVFGAGASNAQGLHAAISFSDEEWTYSYSVNEPSAQAAADAALADCTAADCHIWASWSNGCGVIVAGDDGPVGVGTGTTRAEAEAQAYTSLADVYPKAVLASSGSANLAGTSIVEVICTANAG
ncbi:DUF4189 domain-containing protein [Nocardia lasii]|uniref:DUF4189 domain-containing protein n=1 Tax=Nocardia lasii TaxID=1616107 RepID=A0ABW1JSB1_9NOCA